MLVASFLLPTTPLDCICPILQFRLTWVLSILKFSCVASLLFFASDIHRSMQRHRMPLQPKQKYSRHISPYQENDTASRDMLTKTFTVKLILFYQHIYIYIYLYYFVYIYMMFRARIFKAAVPERTSKQAHQLKTQTKTYFLQAPKTP